MTLTGSILPRLRGIGRTLDRRDETLTTAWVCEADSVPPGSPDLAPDGGEAPAWSAAVKTVIVMLSGRCAAAERALESALAAGLRVYVIAHEGWDEGRPGGLFERHPSAPALVRRVPRPPVSAVWTAEGAWIWFGDDPTAPTWRMPLDPAQSEALRLACLRLFWHHGIDEGFNRNGALVFRPCAPRPFDVPEARAEAPLRIVEGLLPVTDEAGDGVVHTDALADLPSRASRVWYPPSGRDHDVLARLSAQGTEVVWSPRGLPRCSVGSSEARITPRSARWSMSLRLSTAQREALRAVLEAGTQWRFVTGITLGALAANPALQVLLPTATEAVPLTACETLQAPEVLAPSLRDCAAAKPAQWPSPRPLSLTARWHWSVRPPSLPKSSQDDPLVDLWRRFDADFATRVSRTESLLAQANQQQGVLGRTFDALKGALLGFDRTGVGLRARLTALTQEVPSRVGPERSRALAQALLEIEQETATLVKDMDAAERQAEADRARSEQRTAFDQSQREATRQRDACQTELDATRRKLDAQRREIEALLATTAGDDAEAADRAVKLAGRRDEAANRQKHVHLLESRLREFEQQLARPFVFRPPATRASGLGGTGFVPAASSSLLRPPNIALPAVGRLRLAKERYLAIRAWEDLDAGEREATRLDATLVADLEAA